MSRHFDYLLKDESNAFFQKVAIDTAGESAADREPVPRAPLTKTAAPAPTTFEKVASRLERDLETLEAAGPVGLNAGMTKRANAYIDVLMSQAGLSGPELAEVFDKVAAAAIRIDLVAARHQLCAQLPERYHELVDDELVKIGADMSAAALHEKDALLEKIAIGVGALNRLGHVAEETGAISKASRGIAGGLESGARAVEGSPGVAAGIRASGGAAKELGQTAGKAIKDVGTSIGQKAYKGLAAVGSAVVGKPLEAAGKGLDKLRQFRTNRMMSAPERIEGALAKTKTDGALGTGVKKSLEKQLGEADTKRTANLAKNNPNPPHANVPAAAGEAKQVKAEGERQQSQASAASAAKSPKPPKADASASPKAGGGETEVPKEHASTPAPPGGSEGKPPGFMDAWKKATTGGWKALSAEERGTLIRGGVTAALVYRSVTGKGAVTGGEGMI